MIFVVLASWSKAKLIWPTSGLVIFVSSARTKNISLPRLVETDLLIPPSRSTEGRIAIVTDAGWDAVDARSVCSLPPLRGRVGEGVATSTNLAAYPLSNSPPQGGRE